MSRLVARLCLLFSAMCLLWFVYEAYEMVSGPTRLLDESRERSQLQATDVALQIERELKELEQLALTVAEELRPSSMNDDELLEHLERLVEANPRLFGIGLAFVPFARHDDRRLFAPYVIRDEDGIRSLQIEDVYDYTAPDPGVGSGPRTAWYHGPLSDGPGWNEPYYGTASETYLAEYGVPISDGGGTEGDPVAVLFVNFSLDQIRAYVGSLDLGPSGYGFVRTADGTIVSHPIRSSLGGNINTLALSSDALFVLKQETSRGRHRELYNPRTG
ncbi:hypothetical protein IIC65_02715, partial [Candidatus Sumerlaeota bacterium]|nr:hypothetical protein [Candidatus Sumerlaeota bacterium]